MNKDFNYYKDLIKDANISVSSIARDLREFMSYRTVERFFSGHGINKTNEQIIINHVNQITK